MSNFNLNKWIKENKHILHKSAENIAVEHIFKNKINEMKIKEKNMIQNKLVCKKSLIKVLPHSQEILYPVDSVVSSKVVQIDSPPFKPTEFKPTKFNSKKGKWLYDKIYTHPYKKSPYGIVSENKSPKYRDQVSNEQIFDEQKWLTDKLYTNKYDKKKYKNISSKTKSTKYIYDNVDEINYKPLPNNDLNIELDTKAMGAFTTNTSTLFNKIVNKIANNKSNRQGQYKSVSGKLNKSDKLDERYNNGLIIMSMISIIILVIVLIFFINIKLL